MKDWKEMPSIAFLLAFPLHPVLLFPGLVISSASQPVGQDPFGNLSIPKTFTLQFVTVEKLQLICK